MGRKTKVALTVGAAGLAAWATSKAMAQPVPREDKKALAFEKPVILANQGGVLEAPENTIAAFAHAASVGVQGFAVDVRLTKDKEIVVFQDEYVGKMTKLSGPVSDFTLDELKAEDISYQTEGVKSERFNVETELKLLSLRELLEKFPNMFVCIQMADTPHTYEGSIMPSKLWEILQELKAEERVVITSPYDEQIDRFNLYAQGSVAVGAGNEEVKKAYAAFTSQLGHLYSPKADLFKIPEKLGVLPMNTEGFINFLRKLNVVVYFEKINDEETIQSLLKAGATGIITDRPTLAVESTKQ